MRHDLSVIPKDIFVYVYVKYLFLFELIYSPVVSLIIYIPRSISDDMNRLICWLIILSNLWIRFSFFALWHINLRGLSNAKAILEEEQSRFYLIRSRKDKGVYTFPKDIGPKLNGIARLSFELANNYIAL